MFRVALRNRTVLRSNLLRSSARVVRIGLHKSAVQDGIQVEPENEEPKDNTPWYLRKDVASAPKSKKKVDLPPVPEHAPGSVGELLHLLASDYGIVDIELFDMNSLDESHEYRRSNQGYEYIIIGTGQSERHNFKAAEELNHYIKHKWGTLAKFEGMTNNSQSPLARRRMLRRARKGAYATDNEYGKAPNSWVMCDTHTDNIAVHILTSERRQQLNLESLWCKPEDLHKYTPQTTSYSDSDDIFIGIRRYHTRAFHSSVRRGLDSHLVRLRNADSESLTQESIAESLAVFNEEFSLVPDSINKFNAQSDFYTTVHGLYPEVVSFETAKNAILAKYNSPVVLLDGKVELESEKLQDIVRFMKLLIDSTELTTVDGKEYNDMLFDQLARFISQVTLFSNTQIDISADPTFIPLLWRMAMIEKRPFIGSRLVDQIIHEGHEIPQYATDPIVKLASNRAQGVLLLINYFNRNAKEERQVTAAFKELVLFTYGNANHWAKFWDYWDTSVHSLSEWTRLVVFLACRNDQAQNQRFFSYYWNDLEATLEQGFTSEEERIALKSALAKLEGTNATIVARIESL